MHRKPNFLNQKSLVTLLFIFFVAIFISCDNGGSPSERTAEAMEWTDKEYGLFQEAKFDSALICLDKADSIAPDNDTVKAYTAAERAVILSTMGKMRESVPFAKRSIDISLKIEDYETAFNMYTTLGIVYRRLSLPDSALYFYKQGLNIADHVESKDYVANLLTSLSVIYAQKDRFDEALHYVEKAEQWAMQATDTVEGKIELYNALGVKCGILSRQGKYKEVREATEPHLDGIIATGRSQYILKCINPLVTAYINLGLTDKAEALLRRSQPFMDEMGETSNGYIGMLECEAKLFQRRGEYKKELETWNRLEKLYRQNQSAQLNELEFHKAECYAHLGDNGAAFGAMRRAYQISDSLKNSDIDEQISEFSVRYKTQEKELELARVKEEKAEQLLLMLSVITVLAVGCAVLVIIVMRIQQRRKLARQAGEIEMGRRFIAGMEEERARLARELHDGTCNDLLGLTMLMSQHDSRSLDTVRKIRDNVRRISHELMPPRFAEVDINSVLGDYVCNYPIDACDVSYRADETVDWTIVPGNVAYEFYRIAQETMGNIVKHSHAKHIDVALSLGDGKLSMTIDNDGVDTNAVDCSTGIGSHTVSDRMKSIGGTVTTSVVDGVYHIVVSVPMKERKK